MNTSNTENTHQAEVVYESKGCTPAGTPFMSVKRARGYYEYAERGGQDSIFFVLYDKMTDKFALIYESKPPMDERENREVRMCTAFGGSIDMGDDYCNIEICQTEVAEETGYEVAIERITSVGKSLVSTQMSQMAEGFFVDVTGIPKTLEAEYEKAASEAQAEKDANEFSGNDVLWLSKEEVLANGDWKSIYVIAKYFGL